MQRGISTWVQISTHLEFSGGQGHVWPHRYENANIQKLGKSGHPIQKFKYGVICLKLESHSGNTNCAIMKAWVLWKHILNVRFFFFILSGIIFALKPGDLKTKTNKKKHFFCLFVYLLRIYLSTTEYQTLEFASTMHISNKG